MVWKKFAAPNVNVATATCASERLRALSGLRSEVAPAPTRSHVASNASMSPAVLPGVNDSPSRATTSNTVTIKFSRNIDALVLTDPIVRLRMK